MPKSGILADIARSEAKIIATQESKVFSPEYKEKTLAEERAFIANGKIEIIAIDRILRGEKI